MAACGVSCSLAGCTALVSRGRRCAPCWPEPCWRPQRHSAPAPLCRARRPRAWTARLYSKVGEKEEMDEVHSLFPHLLFRLKNQLYISVGKETIEGLRFSCDYWQVQWWRDLIWCPERQFGLTGSHCTTAVAYSALYLLLHFRHVVFILTGFLVCEGARLSLPFLIYFSLYIFFAQFDGLS